MSDSKHTRDARGALCVASLLIFIVVGMALNHLGWAGGFVSTVAVIAGIIFRRSEETVEDAEARDSS